MKNFYKIIALFILLCVGVYLGQYLFRYLYFLLPAGNGPILFGTDQTWSYIFGAISAFYFILPLLLIALFYNIRLIASIIVLLLLLPILMIFYSDPAFISMLIIVTLAGWLMGRWINNWQ